MPSWKENYKRNVKLALDHMPTVKRLILENLPLLIDIDTASPKRDMEEATDLILSIRGGDIGVRIRANDCWRRDWTVRSIINWAERTEIDKLREGFGDWYFYGWSEDNIGALKAWILIDLKKVRDCGLLDTVRNDIPNGDGTFFRAYTYKELVYNDCIISAFGLTL